MAASSDNSEPSKEIDVAVTGLTQARLFKAVGTIVAAILGAAMAIAGTLVFVIYGGIKDRIAEMREDHIRNVTRLEKSLQDVSNMFLLAQRSAVDVADLLRKAPDLEKKINETHATVMTHGVLLQGLQRTADQHTQSFQQLQSQLADIQRRLPPAPR